MAAGSSIQRGVVTRERQAIVHAKLDATLDDSDAARPATDVAATLRGEDRTPVRA